MNKLHILPIFMKEHDFPDVVAVTESWCNVRDVEGLISIPGYTTFRADRGSRGGGVVLYVRSYLNAVTCSGILETCGYREVVCCRIKLACNDYLLITVVYRPESNSVHQNECLFKLLSSLRTVGDQRLLLMGDIIFKHVDWTSYSWPADCDAFMESVHDGGWHQFVTFPTRDLNTLDLVFANEPYLVSEPAPVSGLGCSDHIGVFFKFIVSSRFIAPPTTKRDFSKVDWSAFRLLMDAFLQNFDPRSSPKDMWRLINDSIKNCIQAFVPLRRSKATWKPPWADRICFRALQNQRTKLRKFMRTGNQTDLDSYKIASTRVSLETSRSVSAFESRLAANINFDPKSFCFGHM